MTFSNSDIPAESFLVSAIMSQARTLHFLCTYFYLSVTLHCWLVDLSMSLYNYKNWQIYEILLYTSVYIYLTSWIKTKKIRTEMIVCLDYRDERVTSLVVYHGTQSFSCAECGKTATRKGDLMRHIVSKHVAVPAAVCPVCNRQYKNQNSLNNHISLQHRSWESRANFYPRIDIKKWNVGKRIKM